MEMDRFTLEQVNNKLILTRKSDLYVFEHKQVRAISIMSSFLRDLGFKFYTKEWIERPYIPLPGEPKGLPFQFQVLLTSNDAMRFKLDFTLKDQLMELIEQGDRIRD